MKILNSILQIPNYKHITFRIWNLEFGIKGVIVCLLLILSPLLAHANYPKPTDDYMNDFAGIMNTMDRETIRKTLSDLEYGCAAGCEIENIPVSWKSESYGLPIYALMTYCVFSCSTVPRFWRR